jgi:UDP-GlcNAc:undecaprenyl-phosphate GlcNAc-1-phosphate transferase
LGFLVFNFKPASIFLGESGSLFLGFMLGVLAVISGGKIATTLIVVAIPALDVVRVIVVRLLRGRPISLGDREHLHFRLLDSGYSERTVVLVLYAVAALCGGLTLFLQSTGKLIALSILVLGMLALSIFFYRRTPYSS